MSRWASSPSWGRSASISTSSTCSCCCCSCSAAARNSDLRYPKTNRAPLGARFRFGDVDLLLGCRGAPRTAVLLGQEALDDAASLHAAAVVIDVDARRVRPGGDVLV